MRNRFSCVAFFLFCSFSALGQRHVEEIRRTFLDPSSSTVLVASHRATHNAYPENPLLTIQESLTTVLAGKVLLINGQQTLRHKPPMISAHRGASKIFPENTRVAFLGAINLGVDFIEIDVRTASDGTQVIMHDGSLKRTTGLDARVDRTNLSVIKRLSAGEWFNIQFKDEGVPTLEDICELVRVANRLHDRNVKLYVDCKAINTGEVIRIINQYSLLDSAVFYGNLRVLKEIRKFSDKARLIPPFPGKDKMERIIRKIKPYAFDVPYTELDKETVDFCHLKGVNVFSDLLGQYDNSSSYRKAISMYVDLIQTDDVAQVLQTFKEFKQTTQE